ncbi:transcriptional regulator [Pseudomonas sp. App30]|uniref:helix-turn-helix domain-containing protein n=1 Tax=Pseudomonas sp. App30 TaxID=3068990 RepID=UPI003A7F706F
MNPSIKFAAEHWHLLSPLLAKPRTEHDYDALVASLDELLDLVGADEEHPLSGLVDHLGDLIAAYDHEHRPMPKASGAEVLKLLMDQHRLKQADLAEVGPQSVISEILAGKRQLNLRQIRALSLRFKVSADLFV